jgi:glycine cleavage system aminomethyltransferase T/glycine/D-amino acid oxidase-like deaminating enzyme
LLPQQVTGNIVGVIRDRAETVIVGAGIVGTSAAYHLAELGMTDVLVLDQGPLFETGGSTSHAPGLVFQTNGSRTMCRIAQDTVALYATLELDGEPCWFGVGGIEIATTPERMRELKRRLGFARSYGIAGAELLTAKQAAEMIPLLDASTIFGAYHVPSDGIAKAVRLAGALAREASIRGVGFEGVATVTGFDVRGGRVHGVRTDRGDVECERVLICAGIWGPSVGAMAGVPIPLVAVQHQLVWTDPLPELAGETREVVHPILRHQDMAMYFRHRGDHYAIGNYRHDPIVTPHGDLRHTVEGAAMPSVMPFTPEDFDAAEAEAARVLPALAGRMRPEDPARSINGMFSFTPDGASIVGESARVRGMWVCEAVWVTHGGGMGRQVAEWIALGEPSYDLAEADVNRFYPYATTAPYVLERGKQQYREVYDIIHPRQQMLTPRKLKLTPFYRRHMHLAADFVTGAGWERPQWFDANRTLLTGAPWERRNAWAARLWSPIEGAEHLATREGAALFDLTPFAKLDVEGPDALAFLERICANRIDRPTGSIVYTSMLTPSGGIRCDLTVIRRASDLFRVVTGGGSGQHDLAWIASQLLDTERVTITERTGSLFALGLWGPRAREILQAVTDTDVSNEAFPYLTARYLDIGMVGPVYAQRISYVGELGWELYGQIAMGDHAWGLLWEAGREHGLIAAGLGALDSLRLEKGYRLWGQDVDTEHDPLEAGLGFAVDWDKEFQGKAALEERRSRGPVRRLTPMTFDDPSMVVMGKEPIRHDGEVVAYVTSAGYGYSIGKGIVYGYLPVDLAIEGTPVEVEYFDERFPATVASEPLFDPKGERLKG